MAARGLESDEELFGWWRLVLASTAVLASFVALANLAICVEVIRNATGEFIAQESANKLSSIVGCLAPILLSAGVVLYAVYRLRASLLPDDEEALLEEDTGTPPAQPAE
jgi:hypothetical protein